MTARHWLYLCVALLSGCISYDRTNDPRASKIANRCFALAADSFLSGRDDGIAFQGEIAYLIQAVGSNRCTPVDGVSMPEEDPCASPSTFRCVFIENRAGGLPHCWHKPIAKLPKGTRILIAKVIDQSWGEGSRCWNIKAKILEGNSKGLVANIPACILDRYESPLWLSWAYAADEDLRRHPLALRADLQLRPEYAVPCE